MPIYEFKCLKCGEVLEVITSAADEERRLVCSACNGEDFERILSSTSYVMGSSGNIGGARTETRKCTSGSCTTYQLPGETR
ncbi:MAG: FmdB family transcriptional regulator [Desulfobacterales bacterium]|nr:MAG: FmdB family transcriptional regulator [Desulfobacterales bacterium]